MDVVFDEPVEWDDVPRQDADSPETSVYSCGHEVRGPSLAIADTDELAVERRRSEETAGDPTPAPRPFPDPPIPEPVPEPPPGPRPDPPRPEPGREPPPPVPGPDPMPGPEEPVRVVRVARR